MRYAHTSDFKTFTPAQTYVNRSPTDVIDLTILPVPPASGAAATAQSFVRFIKDETKKTVFAEVSSTGLFGNWTRPGGSAAIIQSGVEGPAAYWDNVTPGKMHLLLDHYGADGYRPYESSNPGSNSGWTTSDRGAFPKNLRHGSVLPVNASLYAALKEKWG